MSNNKNARDVRAEECQIGRSSRAPGRDRRMHIDGSPLEAQSVKRCTNDAKKVSLRNG